MAALRIPRYAHIHKLAIVDDESSDAQIPEWEVEAAGFEPLLINRRFRSIEDLAAFIKMEAQGVLCAHRLADYGFSRFYGAKLVAFLYDLKVPALLISRYAHIDNDVSIRKWRDKVPVLLHSDEADAERIKRGIEQCLAELHGDVQESRRPYRVLLRITDVAYESTEKVVDAILPGWNPRKAVRFPVSLLPPELQEKVAPDVAFFARVNIGTDNVDELYFREFELAPEPDDEDGLA